MKEYEKVEAVNKLILENEAYTLGAFSTLLKAVFLFICLVIMPVMILFSHIDFDESPSVWVFEIILLCLGAGVFMLAFFAIIAAYSYLFRYICVQQLKKSAQLHLTLKQSIFSSKYCASFDFLNNTVVFASHFKRIYITKGIDEIAQWDVISLAKQDKKKKSAGAVRPTKSTKPSKKMLITISVYDTEEKEKAYAFSFKAAAKKALWWKERFTLRLKTQQG